jgi:hypothetical protein
VVPPACAASSACAICLAIGSLGDNDRTSCNAIGERDAPEQFEDQYLTAVACLLDAVDGADVRD